MVGATPDFSIYRMCACYHVKKTQIFYPLQDAWCININKTENVFLTSLVTFPSPSRSIDLKSLSSAVSSPINSSKDSFPSKSLSISIKNFSTSSLKKYKSLWWVEINYECFWITVQHRENLENWMLHQHPKIKNLINQKI